MKPYSIGMRLLNFGIHTAGVAVLITAFFVVGPWLETKWYPVYSKFTIIRMEKVGDTQSRVVFRFTKLRQCEPQGSAWFFGEPGAFFRQIRTTIERPKGVDSVIRPLGTHISNPYVMDVSVEQIASATYAEIYSRCHPFWLTRSVIYP